MKQELPDTQAELLTYLKENPKGMTTGQLFAMTRQKRYFKFKNSTNVSACINAMRTKNLITTSDAHGGKVHKITQFGLDQLNDENGEQAPDTKKQEEPNPMAMAALADNIITQIQHLETDPQTKTYPLSAIVDSQAALKSDENKLESLFDQIRELVQQETFKIADKKAKLAVLERVAGFVRVEDADWLNKIRADLEIMETE